MWVGKAWGFRRWSAEIIDVVGGASLVACNGLFFFCTKNKNAGRIIQQKLS